jgi:hypothetical protein
LLVLFQLISDRVQYGIYGDNQGDEKIDPGDLLAQDEPGGIFAESEQATEKPPDEGLYPDIPRGFLLRRRDRYHFDPDQQIAAQPDYGTGCFHSRRNIQL